MDYRRSRTLLLVSVLPFVGFGAFMVARILRITHGRNNKLVIPFILFVVFFCAVPVAGVFSTLRKLKKTPNTPAIDPSSEGETSPDAQSRIQIRDTPDGREFLFLPARNPGMASVVVALVVFWSAMTWGLFYAPVLMVVPLRQA